MRVLVFGAGAIGSLFGGLLSRAHEVTLVGRPPHLDAIRANGLRIESDAESFLVRPETAARVPSGSFDLAAIAVKTYDLHDACAALAASGASFRWILCLQNGIGNEEILRAHFPDETIVRGLVYNGVSIESPGRIVWFGHGSTWIGRPLVPAQDGEADLEIEDLASALSAGGFPARRAEEIGREIWKKLAVNAAINPLGAITGLPNGALVRSSFLLSLLRAAVRETEEVARAEAGYAIDMVERTMEIALVTGRNRNSMLLDLEAGRPTEIEFLSGAIVRFARRRDLAVPVTRTLHALVRGKEEALRVRSADRSVASRAVRPLAEDNRRTSERERSEEENNHSTTEPLS